MPLSPRLLDEIVELPYPAMAYRLSERIHSQFPNSAVLETEDDDFKLPPFAEAGGCAVTLNRHIFGYSEANWRGNQVRLTPATAALDVEWRGHRLMVVQVMYDEYAALRSVIVADSPSIAEQFFAAVCRFNGNGSFIGIAFFIMPYKLKKENGLYNKCKIKQYGMGRFTYGAYKKNNWKKKNYN